ncbi:hypothetical protein TPHA_0L01580 [Tetrapisispora phaffii CBS 4417]|uniref:Magnesium transporter n=1 Tax=Tetrapisispora phaffii (strain ATCC 24235 / CBS 4417 / NBRC 1672 / NRRL Y-8282 / UCD 70-5) TaxID=1071381 RepID=G8C033_TETPH|nr:hypothetical protein TPHA_0L01580 [Tetrapisispora phaffii CBS 4417]CCE65511.1 hypothetical protein TPHA_0L01580 [Tetrapisispora phaffii CBS 4417]
MIMVVTPSSTNSLLMVASRLVPKNSMSISHTICQLIRRSSYSTDPSALLLQKNLIQKNNSLYNYGVATVRCTIFDDKGNIDVTAEELKREDIVSKYGVLPRDLRKIEKSKKYDLVSSLSVRKNSIILNLLNIRSVIQANKVILFDSVSAGISLDSKAHKDFVNDLRIRLSRDFQTDSLVADNLPYEFRALEAMFISTISNLASEMKVLITVSEGILQDLEYNITKDKLKFLLQQNKKLTVFHRKVLLVRTMIDELLEQDEELCAMYLTDKKDGLLRHEDNHTEIEMLLETYYTHIDEIVQKAGSLISDIKTTEEIINIILDSNRNRLMLLGIQFSIGLLSLGGIIFFGSLYGMNVENFIEETKYGFSLITLISIISTYVLFKHQMKRLNNLQKMSLTETKRKRKLK